MGYLKLLALCGAIVALLLAFPLDFGGISQQPMKFSRPQDTDGTIVKIGSLERLTFSVEVAGERVHGWLYVPGQQPSPLGRDPPPVVVTAYGLGVQKDIAMVPFAEGLAKRGLAVLLFDYRNWGVSGGLPRHVSDPVKELEDLRAVLSYLEKTEGFAGRIDWKRVALYGVSLGGGLVLAGASQLAKEQSSLAGNLQAVIAAVPFVSGRAAAAAALKSRDWRSTLRIAGAVAADWLRSLLPGNLAVYIQVAKVAGAGRSLSMMELNAEDYELWASRTPLGGNVAMGAWENKVATRSIPLLSKFQPDELVVDSLDVPTLVIAGAQDQICPPDAIRDLVERHAAHKPGRRRIELQELPISHFQINSSEFFSQVEELVASFVIQHTL